MDESSKVQSGVSDSVNAWRHIGQVVLVLDHVARQLKWKVCPQLVRTELVVASIAHIQIEHSIEGSIPWGGPSVFYEVRGYVPPSEISSSSRFLK
jgi:hypothetical protein